MNEKRMGRALNRWGIANITVWQTGERMIGRDETQRLYPESAEFFKFLNSDDDK